MIVKLIQNLEKKKMESQLNSLETRIEKMQERFNKDLEEIKRVNVYKICNESHSVMSDSLEPHGL